MPRTSFVITDDRREFVLSDAVLDVGFGAGLWNLINQKHGLLLDEYESEDLSVEQVAAVAQTIRDYVRGATLPDGVAGELAELAAFLDDAAARQVAASFVI